MTDDVFESRLRAELLRYAEGGPRPIDAHAVAAATLAAGHAAGSGRGPRAWWRMQDRPTRRLALVAVVTLLLVAVAIAVAAVGQWTKPPRGLTDRQPPPAPVQPSAVPVVRPSAVPVAAQPRMAYIEAGDLYLAGLDGSDPVKVVDDPGVSFATVRWLTDGRHVALDGGGRVTVVDLATGERHPLDGVTGVAYWRPGTDEVVTIRRPVVAPQPSELVFTDAITGAHRTVRSARDLQGLIWSTDGTRLIGESFRDYVDIDPETGTYHLVAQRPDGADQTTWSADLRRIAYVIHPDIPCDMTVKTCKSAAEVYVADVDVGGTIAPTKVAGPILIDQLNGDNTTTVFAPSPDPAISPDGTWVAYRTGDGVVIVHPDGSGRRDLLSVPVDRFEWQLDSHGLYAVATRGGDGSVGELLSVDVADGAHRSLGLDGVSDVAPLVAPPPGGQAWQPATTPLTSPNPDIASPTPAPIPSAFPTTAPTSHRIVVHLGAHGECDGRVIELDLDAATERTIGGCGASFGADGLRVVDGATVTDLRDGSTTQLAGPREPSPHGHWLTTAPHGHDPSSEAALGPTWEIDRLDGTPWMTVPRPWWNPGYGPYFPSWSPRESYVSIPTEQGPVMVDLVRQQQVALNDIPYIQSWSADERRVAFTRDGDAWVANVDGTDLRNVTQFDFGGADGVALSPDGETAAVTQGDAVWLVRMDGSRRAVDIGPVGADRFRQLSWAPDGTWIAVSDIDGEHAQKSGTTFADADGSRIAQVAAASLSFAPDGHAAALWLSPSDLDPQSTTAKSPTADGRMTLVDRSGHLVTIADAWEAYWAPDSTRLVVRAGKESAQRLDVVEAAGTNRDVVTAGPVVVTALSWIPDR